MTVSRELNPFDHLCIGHHLDDIFIIETLKQVDTLDWEIDIKIDQGGNLVFHETPLDQSFDFLHNLSPEFLIQFNLTPSLSNEVGRVEKSLLMAQKQVGI